ncbi:regulator [Paenibacillaceae bacterium]|nr:regulator [Paenibacillaceae bacterium]
MKNTGIVRLVDELGRLVLPIELRRSMGITISDPVEFFVNDAKEQLILRKYRTQECIFCGDSEQLAYYHERFVCRSCLLELAGDQLEEGVARTSEVLAETEVLDGIIDSTVKPLSIPASPSAPDAKILNTLPGHEPGFKAKQTRSKNTIQRLAAALEQHPLASQKQLASIIGVSQSRICQLLKEIKQQVI